MCRTCRKQTKSQKQCRNHSVWMHSSFKSTMCEENLWKGISSLTDRCHQTLGSTSYGSEVVVQLSVKHLTIQEEIITTANTFK